MHLDGKSGRKQLFLNTLLASIIAVFGAAAAHAQSEYPSRPIRIIVPFPPGSGTDIVGRAIGQALGEAWKVSVIIDNRPGAGGTIGSDMVAKAAPDGHTLLLGNTSTLALAPTLYSKLPYSPVSDFAPITLITTSHNTLVLHPSVPARSVRELIALAKAKPKFISYGSAGNGTTSHLGGALFASMAGVEMVHVPYKGSAPSLTDLISGQLSLSFAAIATVITHIKSGRLRALGVTSLKRSPHAPDLPAVSETLPGFEVLVWQGIAAPAATPQPVVMKLNAEILRTLRTPEMHQRLGAQGLDAAGGTPEVFGAFIKSETVKWGKVLRAVGARVD